MVVMAAVYIKRGLFPMFQLSRNFQSLIPVWLFAPVILCFLCLDMRSRCRGCVVVAPTKVARGLVKAAGAGDGSGSIPVTLPCVA